MFGEGLWPSLGGVRITNPVYLGFGIANPEQRERMRDGSLETPGLKGHQARFFGNGV